MCWYVKLKAHLTRPCLVRIDKLGDDQDDDEGHLHGQQGDVLLLAGWSSDPEHDDRPAKHAADSAAAGQSRCCTGWHIISTMALQLK